MGRKIRFAAEYDNYPASFYNDMEREWQGVAMEVLDEIGELSGLEFVPANDDEREADRILPHVWAASLNPLPRRIHPPS